MIAVRADGGRTCVIVEWSFTERYDRPIALIGAGGTDRRDVYRARYVTAPLRHRPPHCVPSRHVATAPLRLLR